MSIVTQALKSIGWNSIGTFIRAASGFIQIGFISRYLDSTEIGSYSQLLVMVAFSTLLCGFGLIQAGISKDNCTQEDKLQLNYGFILVAILVASFVVLIAPLAGIVLNNPLLTPLLYWFSPILLILGLGQYSMMMCQKNLEFNKLVICETLGVLAGLSTLIVGLNNGFGVYSVVMSLAANHLCRVTALLCFVHTPGLSIWRFRWSKSAAFFQYGAKFTGASLLSLFVTSADILIISRLLGVEKTGQYGLIKELVFKISTLINPLVLRVALPFYAKVKSHKNLGLIYCYIKELLGYMYIPIYAYLIVFPEFSLSLLLGQKWTEYSLLLQILAGWMIVRAMMMQAGSLLNALGLVGRALKWNIAVAILFPIVIYISAQFDLYAVAFSVFFTQVFLYLPHWYFQLQRTAGVALSSYLLSALQPLLAAFVSLMICYFLVRNIELSPILQFLFSLLSCAAIYLLIVYRRVLGRYKQLIQMGL